MNTIISQLIKSIIEDRSKYNITRLVDELSSVGLDWPLFFSEANKVTTEKRWRLFWFLSHYVDQNRGEATLNQNLIWAYLDSSNNQSIQRDLWHSLTFIKIHESLQSKIYDKAIKVFCNANNAIAVRANAIVTAYNIAIHHPDLQQELYLILNNLNALESAGIKAKARIICAKLKKISRNLY